MNRKSFWILLIAIIVPYLSGCGHHHHRGNEIEVEISEAPPATLGFNAAAQVEATVTGDTANAGVTWSCAPAGTCGTFDPTTTASGAATTYTAPTAAAAVTITATSVTDTSKSASARVNIASGITVNLSTPPPATLAANASASVAATVNGDNANAGVNWSCTPAGSCGSFDPTQTASGGATTYTAPGTASAVTIKATSVSDNTQNATAQITITSAGGGFVIVGTYSFYAAGTSVDDDDNYAIAGSVTIDDAGNITGEQDFNNGFSITSPQPGGDRITSGVLDIDTNTGQGTLTLVTNNTHVGDNGTETLAIDFVNNQHALIAQFDGSATSLGSFDLQTLPSTPTGGFSFTFAGLDSTDSPIVGGGVFTLNGTSLTNGLVDTNDDGEVTLAQAFTATLSAADSFGRGTISNSGIATTIVYYVVGPEVVRIIIMDSTDFAVGSAYGQGTSAGTFSNASIGQSVFSVSGAASFDLSALVGQFSTGAAAAAPAVAHPDGQLNTNTFDGIADVDDESIVLNAVAIAGTYFLDSDGYGRLSITNDPGFFNLVYGVYAVDPTLNLNDPNNTSTGLGGALMANMTDFEDVSVGVLVPQSDTATASFAGGYAFGMQFISDNDEADFVGQGTVTGAAIAGSGVVNDPFEDFFEDSALNIDVPIAGTLVPDLNNPGRYTMHFFDLGVGGLAPVEFDATVYQASGGQLFWIGLTTETDSDTLFNGPIQQQSVASDSAAKAASKKPHKR